jgi:RNA polymerase sigma factor (sigma-70 family)
MDKDSIFRAAIESNKDRIYRVCCCYVSDEDERKDVYQDVLVHVWRSLESFEGRSDISTWIYRITVNTCFGYLRSEQRKRKVIDANVRIDDVDVPDETGGEGTGRTDSDVRRLYGCIAKLPMLERTLVSLYLEELSTKQMSDVLGISEANVRVKLHRTKKVLKDLWEEEEHGTR